MNYLKNDNEKQNPAGDVDLVPRQDHGHGAQLTDQVDHHKQRSQEPEIVASLIL